MHPPHQRPVAVIMMGVTGSGKSTIGRALAERRGCAFLDGDDYHPQANIEKMRRGEPLNDDDRAPWLDILRELITDKLAAGEDVVVACSALRESYRQRLLPGNPDAASGVRFVYLRISPDLSRERLLARGGHFMPATLVGSQFAALEEPADALSIEAGRGVEEVVEQIDRSLPPRN